MRPALGARLLPLALLVGCGGGRGSAFRPYPRVADTLCINHFLPGEETPLAQRSRDWAVRTMQDLGVRTIRRDFSWSEIEPSRGTFAFEPYDLRVDRALEAGLRHLPILCYGTLWASAAAAAAGDTAYPPDDPADFAAYAAATADHFRGRIDRYEVWNEPDGAFRFWKSGSDPAGYGRLLEAAYTALKGTEPDLRVSNAGFSSTDPWTFFVDMVRRTPASARSFDALAIHPYTSLQTASPEQDRGLVVPTMGFTRMLDEARSDLALAGRGGSPLWVTELGWPTWNARSGFYGYGVTDADQARYLVRSFVLALSRGVELLCWYDLIDFDGSVGPTTGENYFGLYEYSPDPGAVPPVPKPSAAAYAALARVLGPTRFEEDLGDGGGLPDGVRALRFRGSDRVVQVAWSTTPGVSLGLPARGETYVVDALGLSPPLAVVPSGVPPRVNLTLGPTPLYLVEVRGRGAWESLASLRYLPAP